MAKKSEFLYRKVYHDIKEKIISGEWRPDDRLPSERELGQLSAASTITVKHALKLLCEEGVLYRIQGRGTFVRRGAVSPHEGGGTGKLVGLVLEHISSPYGLQMTYQMIFNLEKYGYRLCIRFSFGDPKREAEQMEALLALGVSGLIIMPCHDSYYSMTIMRLMMEHFPMVLIDKRMHGLPISTVCTDGSGAVRTLVRHLAERGCRNIALITIDPNGTTSLKDRIAGFREGMREAGLTPCAEWMLPKRTSFTGGEQDDAASKKEYAERIGAALDDCDPMPDGLICTEYALAYSLYHAARERGLTLGTDIRACCIDEDEEAVGGYTFTHMRQDEATLAEKAVQELMGFIDGESQKVRDVSVPALFKQGSTT